MNIFKRVTKNTLKEAKVRTIVTIVGVVLATCLFTAATTFVWSLFNYAEEIDKQFGDYHVQLEDVDMSLYTRMQSDKDVAYMTQENYVGQGKFNDYDNLIKYRLKNKLNLESVYPDDIYCYIYGIDNNYFMVEKMDIVKGRMPKSSKEVVISEVFAEILGEKGNIGSVINVPLLKTQTLTGEELDKDMIENKDNYSQSYEYTIVGYHKSGPYMYAYTYNDADVTYTESELYVKLNKKFGLSLKRFLEKYNIDIDDEYKVKYVNTTMLAFAGALEDIEELVRYFWFFIIFFIIIGVASIVLISSTFMISVSERTKQFGLLSSIGATKKQLFKSLIYEASYVSSIGIPIGIIIGIVGMGITLKCLGLKISKVIISLGSVDREIIELKFKIHPMAIIIAIILTLVTIGISLLIPFIRLRKVTAIEAIRQSKEIKVKRRKVKVSRLTKKLAGLEGILATKYYKVNSSKYRVTLVSLAMSIVLFIVTFSVSGMAKVIVKSDVKDYPYDVRIEQLNIYDENDTKLPEFMDNLKGLKDVKNIKYSYSDWEKVVINKEEVNETFIKDSEWYSEYVEQAKNEKNKVVDNDGNVDDVPEKIVQDIMILYVDNVQYNEILEKEGLDKSKYIGVDEPKALVYNKSLYSDDKQNDIFNKTKYSLSVIDSEKIENNANGYGEDYYYNLWPEVRYHIDEFKDINTGKVVYYDRDEDNNIIGLKEGELYTNELAIGDFIYSLPYIQEMVADPYIYVIYPENVVNEAVDSNVYINVKDYNSFSTEFYKLLAKYGIDKDQVDDFVDKNNLVESMMLIVKVFIYGFLILVGLTSVANVFNTITTNIILRRRDIATLRSVGLDGKSINKMLRYECLIYGIKAIVIGIPLAVVANFGISKILGIDGFSEYGAGNIMNYLGLLIPYKAIIIAVVNVLCIVYISMVYALHIIKKDNILDTLKNENI